MNEITNQDNRPSVYWEGDLLIIRASAIGHPCLWELIAAGQGYEPLGLPAGIRRAFQEGHDAEPLIIEELEKPERGFVFETKQVEGELLLPGNIAIRYHPDGIGYVPLIFDPTQKFVFEIKNLSHDVYMKAFRAGNVGATFEEYNSQLSVMMLAEHLPAIWIARNKGYPPDKETGIKPFCSREGEIFVQDPIYEPIIPFEQIAEKAQLIKEGVLGEDLLTTDRECDSPEHFPCRYLHIRPEPEEGSLEDSNNIWWPAEDEQEELDSLVRDMLTFKGQADEAKKRYEAIRDTLMEKIPEGVERVVTDQFVIPILQASSNTINWAAMSPELKKVIEKYRTKTPGKRYTRDITRRS